MIGTDPPTSAYNGGDGAPFHTEAAGHYRHPDTVDDVWPRSFHTDVLDRIEVVGDREAILTVRALARQEGLLVTRADLVRLRDAPTRAPEPAR